MSNQNIKKTDKNFYKEPDNTSKPSVYTVNVDPNHSIPCFNNNEYGFVIPPKNLIIRFFTCKKCGSLPDVDFVRLFLLASYSNNYFLLENYQNYQEKNILKDKTKNDILKKNKNVLEKDLKKNNQGSEKNLLEYVETNVNSNKKGNFKSNKKVIPDKINVNTNLEDNVNTNLEDIEKAISDKINVNEINENSGKANVKKINEIEIGENSGNLKDEKINENVVEVNVEKINENVAEVKSEKINENEIFESSGNSKDEKILSQKEESDRTTEIDKIEVEKDDEKIVIEDDEKIVIEDDIKNDEKDVIENSTQQKKVMRKSAYNSLLYEKIVDTKLKSRQSSRSIKKQEVDENSDGLNNISENRKKFKRKTDKSDLPILENNAEVPSLDTKNNPSNSEKVVKKYKPIHKCIDCNLTFVSKVKFNQHTKLNHPNDLSLIDKPFKCPIKNCDRPYKNRNGLEYHLIHSHFVSRKSLDKYMADYNLE